MSHGRRSVSYFENQFDADCVYDPSRFIDTAKRDMETIADLNFDEVVLCVTEPDIRLSKRRQLLEQIVQAGLCNDLIITADPWRVGGVFGGEGMSLYEQAGGKPCTDCAPELNDVVQEWVTGITEAGIERIFWDEATLSCDKPGHARSGEFVLEARNYASQKGVVWNSTCVNTRRQTPDSLYDLAATGLFEELAVAPYPFHPGAGAAPPAEQAAVANKVRPWFEALHHATALHNIGAQVWVQGFNVMAYNYPATESYIDAAQRAGIGNLALWGYNACERIPSLNPHTDADPAALWKYMSSVVPAA